MIWYSDAQLRAWAEMNRGQFDPVVIDSADNQKITANITIGGTTTSYNIGDTVIDLQYTDGDEIKSVSGTIKYITFTCESVTPVKTSDPIDHFSEDVGVESFMIETDDGNVTVAIDSLVGEDISTSANAVAVTNSGQEIKVSDVLENLQLEGVEGVAASKYIVKAFSYRKSDSVEVYIAGLIVSAFGGDGSACVIPVNKIKSFDKREGSIVSETDSLAQIATALNDSTDGVVFASLSTDVNIPKRDDGRITTLMINENQELHVDLGGHNIDCEAYAFYVNGGTLTISDNTGNGAITTRVPDKAYPAVFITNSGVCNMESGIIDTTQADIPEGSVNWMYGAVCSGNGIFNMTGGSMKIADAAGISITNGTASGEGAKFYISGDAKIESVDATAIYLADNKSIDISGNAEIDGGILLRIGDLTVRENAVVNSHSASKEIYPLGKLVCESGCESHNAAILALTGVYKSSLGNDLNIRIESPANVNGKIDNAIDIGTINTVCDQNVNVEIENSKDISFVNKLVNVYNHDQLAELATEQGKTLAEEKFTTSLIVSIDGEEVAM